MATKNDITGDSIRSKGSSENYSEGWDRIFGSKDDQKLVEDYSAVYDNPTTMCREAWHNKVLVSHISANLMLQKGFDGHPNMDFRLNVGKDFIPGNIVGDKRAISPDALPKRPWTPY